MRMTIKAVLLPLALMAGAPALAQDSATTAAAGRAAAALVPEGTYARIFSEKFPEMMEQMLPMMLNMSPAEMGAGSEKKSMRELARARDPHFEERMSIMMRVMAQEMGKVMAPLEPEVRGAMGRILARRFNAAELDEMNRFFASPVGTKFAGSFIESFMDKEMMEASIKTMPALVQAMPGIMQKVQAATAHLPPPPKPKKK